MINNTDQHQELHHSAGRHLSVLLEEVTPYEGFGALN